MISSGLLPHEKFRLAWRPLRGRHDRERPGGAFELERSPEVGSVEGSAGRDTNPGLSGGRSGDDGSLDPNAVEAFETAGIGGAGPRQPGQTVETAYRRSPSPADRGALPGEVRGLQPDPLPRNARGARRGASSGAGMAAKNTGGGRGMAAEATGPPAQAAAPPTRAGGRDAAVGRIDARLARRGQAAPDAGGLD